MSKNIDLKSILPSFSKKVFIIAEVGINHEGSYARCKKLITLASNSGADAVKIQTMNPELNYCKRSESFKNLPIYNFSVTTIIFYLSSYFLLPFSSRILESSNLLILLSTNYLFKSQRILITILIATQTIYLYFFKWENLLLL